LGGCEDFVGKWEELVFDDFGCLATTLLMNDGGLCSYLEDVFTAKRHPVSSQAMFCSSLLIHSTTSMSLSVRDFSSLQSTEHLYNYASL